MLKKFAGSDNDGLQEYVMARICCSILEENRLENSWSTGREWYENYIKARD
jgi:predicted translin family RNA/ssDNA-binding protein